MTLIIFNFKLTTKLIVIKILTQMKIFQFIMQKIINNNSILIINIIIIDLIS